MGQRLPEFQSIVPKTRGGDLIDSLAFLAQKAHAAGMLVSCEEMKAIEARAFASGATAESLMEEAGRKIAEAVKQFFPASGECVIWFGKGHNGGDALVAGRHLAATCNVKVQSPFPENEWSELTAKKYREFREKGNVRHTHSYAGMPLFQPLIVLDGLLGIGAGGALREPVRSATREINRLRAASNAQVFAIDLPSGLDAGTSESDPDCVVADFTLTIGFAKKGLVADHAANHVGRLAVLPLAELTALQTAGAPDSAVATGESLAPLLARRKFDSNKGDYGRIGIIAGSVGTTGAAVMCAEAALRGGAGLITLFATPDIYHTLAAACAPEIMARAVESYLEALDGRLDVIAIGPGLGNRDAADILRIIETSPQPMVVDAEALNLVSAGTSLLSRCAGKRLLTPHPGEMARLFPDAKNLTRRETARVFTGQFPVTLLLKGSRTLIAEQGAPFSYNTTGNPGMATGGMGDVLTGVCAALIGQGLSCYDAARVGAWACGRAAEIAIYNGAQSGESLAATDLMGTLGAAFKQLRAGCF